MVHFDIFSYEDHLALDHLVPLIDRSGADQLPILVTMARTLMCVTTMSLHQGGTYYTLQYPSILFTILTCRRSMVRDVGFIGLLRHRESLSSLGYHQRGLWVHETKPNGSGMVA